MCIENIVQEGKSESHVTGKHSGSSTIGCSLSSADKTLVKTKYFTLFFL